MSFLPPAWMIGTQALDANGDPHLAPGVHFRVVTHPVVGLPLRPLVVYRYNLGSRSDFPFLRTDITWTDDDGAVITTPFNLTPGRCIYGLLPVDVCTRCVWIELIHGPIGAVRMDAFICSERGRTIVATSTSDPFIVSASAIHGIILTATGSGVQAEAQAKAPAPDIIMSGIYGVRWINMPTFTPEKGATIVQVLNLPVENGPRYASGLANPAEMAMKRATLAAPRRLGLHDDFTAADPASTDLCTSDDELKRLTEITPDLMEPLKRLIVDMSASQQDLRQKHDIDGLPSPGEAHVSCIGAVLSAAADPGVGRWLGLVGHDPKPPGAPGDIVMYVIRGFWQIDRSKLDDAQRLGLLAAEQARITNATPPDSSLPFPWIAAPVDSGGDYAVYDFRIPTIVTRGTSPARPSPPIPNGQIYYLDLGGVPPWLPAPPPTAMREVALPLSDLAHGACIALTRKDDQGVHSLNEFTAETHRAFSLLVAQPDEMVGTNRGVVFDRTAPEGKCYYGAAQADWFGRWSQWGTREVPAAARPLPPVPVLEPKYTIYQLGAIVPDDARFGSLKVRVPVPPADTLAPGSHLLWGLRLAGTVAGFPFTFDTPIPPGAKFLDIPIAGPPGVLMPCAQSQATVKGCWLPSGGLPGPWSEERTVKLLDPRPPPAVTLDPALKYSARPDVTGRARVALQWDISPGQKRFRVYAIDETRLLAVLQGKPDTASFFAAHAAATTLAERGAAFTSHASLLIRDYFENLTGQALEVEPGQTVMRFQHELSGSLRVLTLYRIVALSELNVETPWSLTPLVPYAVPNSGPPPRPMLNVASLDLPDQGPVSAHLQVRVPRGTVPATRYRLRRSNSTSSDPLRMLVVAEGAIAWESAAPDAPLTFSIDDIGALPGVPGAKLCPWTRYSWRVEVQAPSEPGSTIPGEWSTTSAAASTSVIPPKKPGLADDLSLSPEGVGHRLAWHHAEPLEGGPMGSYIFEVYRRRPEDARESSIGEVGVDAPSAAGGRSPGNTYFFIDPDPVAVGTTYLVVARDPAGRRSDPSGPITT